MKSANHRCIHLEEGIVEMIKVNHIFQEQLDSNTVPLLNISIIIFQSIYLNHFI